jgi:uncharacterized protein (DUF849 family)
MQSPRSGHVSRIGLEDTLLMPDGEQAVGNAALVRAVKALTSHCADATMGKYL